MPSADESSFVNAHAKVQSALFFLEVILKQQDVRPIVHLTSLRVAVHTAGPDLAQLRLLDLALFDYRPSFRIHTVKKAVSFRQK